MKPILTHACNTLPVVGAVGSGAGGADTVGVGVDDRRIAGVDHTAVAVRRGLGRSAAAGRLGRLCSEPRKDSRAPEAQARVLARSACPSLEMTSFSSD